MQKGCKTADIEPLRLHNLRHSNAALLILDGEREAGP